MKIALQTLSYAWNALDGMNTIGLMFIALIYLKISARQRKEEINWLLIFSLSALIIIFNPLSSYLAIELGVPLAYYWILFLILPIVPVLALAIYQFVECAKGRWKIANIIMLLAIGIVWVVGNNAEMPALKSNPFGIEKEQYELLLPIQNELESHRVVLLADDDIMNSAAAMYQDIGLAYEVSYINEDVESVMERYGAELYYLHEQMRDPQNRLGNITAMMQKYGFTYLVLPIDADERYAMQFGGYSVVSESEHYVLYCYE